MGFEAWTMGDVRSLPPAKITVEQCQGSGGNCLPGLIHQILLPSQVAKALLALERSLFVGRRKSNDRTHQSSICGK